MGTVAPAFLGDTTTSCRDLERRGGPPGAPPRASQGIS
jgi:hypothetical protein